MTSLSQKINDKPWHWWLLFLVLLLAGFLPSLGSSPVVWQDEVQIVDYGRVRLDPGTDWAVAWSTHEHKALQVISYLGCIGAELAYRITGSVLGSRLYCIAGGFLLGSLVLGMVARQRGPAVIGLLFAALVVLDPALLDSYRSGRVDALAMAFVLAGALCLQHHARKPDWRWLAAAALALACAPYIWVRAAMSIPAALLPLLFATEMPARKLLRTLLALIALTMVAAALLLPPAWQGLQDLRALVDSPVKEFHALAGNREMISTSALMMRMLDDVWECFLLDAPLLLLAAFGLVTAFAGKGLDLVRKILLALVVLATLVCEFKLTTGLNHYPALYLLPLLVLLAWHGMERLERGGQPVGRARWIARIMALLLAGHVSYNVVDRSYNAWLDRGTLGPDAVQSVVKALPSAPRRLIVDSFRLYFPLRGSGFHPFYLFTDLDHTRHEYRFYVPSVDSGYQPFYLFTRKDKAGHGESFSPAATPGLLVGGGTLMWSAYFEMQLRHPVVKQLPLGYRLVVPATK